MSRNIVVVTGAAALLGLALACTSNSSTPLTPTTPSKDGTLATGSDGTTTLKVVAPVPQSPIGGVKPSTGPATLVVSASTAPFAATPALQYRFQVFNAANAMVEDVVANSTSHPVEAELTVNASYSWQARAEFQGSVGPWSSKASFIAPESGGYILGGELYDPLINGKTVGVIHGPVTFIPGVGARMDAEESYIEYALPQAVTEGEFSALVTGLEVISSNEDPKLRIFTMREGNSAINDNDYRMSVDKRGNGAIAWRFIAGDNRAGRYIETVGSERTIYPFHESLTYFVKATWRGNFFNVEFREGGFDGKVIYSFGKPYNGTYAPSPHMAFAGSPFQGGDRGEPSTLDGMIIRQMWLSSRPRPASANK